MRLKGFKMSIIGRIPFDYNMMALSYPGGGGPTLEQAFWKIASRSIPGITI